MVSKDSSVSETVSVSDATGCMWLSLLFARPAFAPSEKRLSSRNIFVFTGAKVVNFAESFAKKGKNT